MLIILIVVVVVPSLRLDSNGTQPRARLGPVLVLDQLTAALINVAASIRPTKTMNSTARGHRCVAGRPWPVKDLWSPR